MQRFHEPLEVRLRTHREVETLEYWWADRLEVGDDWDTEIRERLDGADFAVLALSADFLDRCYIKEVELPAVLNHPTCLAAPVGLRRFDREAADMCGLEARQMYRLRLPHWMAPKSYNELRSVDHREAFVDGLCAELVRGVQRKREAGR